MGPDIGEVDPFPRFSRRSLRSNNDLRLLLFLLLLCFLGLVRPVGLCVTQHVLLKFLLAPQELRSLILDIFKLLCTLILHLFKLIFMLFKDVYYRFFFFFHHHRVFIFSVSCICSCLSRD